MLPKLNQKAKLKPLYTNNHRNSTFFHRKGHIKGKERNYERGTRKERGMVKNVYNGWKARCKIKYGLKPWQVMFTISIWKLGLLGENNTWNKLEKHICFSHTLTKWSQCTRNYMSIKIQCPWQFSDNRRYFSWYLKITRLNLDDSN